MFLYLFADSEFKYNAASGPGGALLYDQLAGTVSYHVKGELSEKTNFEEFKKKLTILRQ